MSKDSFKVKKGLTLTPIDPADITNPQAGDLIADSTDDNKIKKYDATSSDWTSVGGSAGIGGNLMSEFEKLTPTVSNVTSATDTVTFLPIDDNNKSIKATWAGSVGSIQYQVALDSSLQEIQGTVSVWLRTSLSDIQISSVQDGVKISTLAVTGNNKWKQYEIPMVLGGSNVGFIVESLTAQTGDVFIDEVFVGLTPSSYAFDVAQTEYLGRVEYAGAASCLWTTASTTFTNYSAVAACNDPTLANGSRIKVPSTKIPAVVLPAGSPAGTYKFVASGMFYKNVTDYGAWRFSDGVNHSQQSGTYLTAQAIGTVSGEITYDGSLTSDTTVNLQARNQNGNVQVYANISSSDFAIAVYYYPPQSTIVTQVQTLDASTANEFSARVEAHSTITSENGIDWLDTCTYNASFGTVCTFQSGIFTETPSCVATPFNNAGNDNAAKIVAGQTDNTKVTIEVLTGGTRVAVGFHLHCSKQGADYNKSAMIVGNFEQIKTTELCQVRGEGGLSTHTNNLPMTFTEVSDNCNAWDGDEYTAQKDGYILFQGNFQYTTVRNGTVLLYKNGSQYQNGLSHQDSVSAAYPFTFIAEAQQGDIFYISFNNSATLTTAASQRYISITELPDIAGIVKNLNDNKNVKCQTKYLSANTSSTGILSDLTFNNLTIGKSYSVNFKHNIAWTATGQAANNVNLEYGDGTDIEPSTLGGQHNINNIVQSVGISIKKLKVLQSTLQFNLTSSITSQLLGDGTRFRTYAEICELPDYYIETDEW